MRNAVRGLLGLLVLSLLPGCGGGGGEPFEVPRERLASADAQARGRQLYVAYCARCHGREADGRGVGAPSFGTPPTDFTRPAWQTTARPGMVYVQIRRGVPGTAMPAWGFLPETEVWDLVAYLLSLE